MDLEMNKQPIALRTQIAQETFTVNVDTDAIVPDSKPDIAEILETDAVCTVSGSEVQTARIVVYGTVDFHVLYRSEDARVCAMMAQATFTDVQDIAGAAAGQTLEVTCRVQELNEQILNGRKLNFSAKLRLEASLYDTETVTVVTEAAGEDLQVRRKKLCYCQDHGTKAVPFDVSDRLVLPPDLPSADALLKVNAAVSDVSSKIINNKVIVKGETDLVAIYTGEDTSEICCASFAVPFTEVLEIDGIREDWHCWIRVEPVNVTWELMPDDDGENRVFSVRAALCAYVACREEETLDAVIDCYSTKGEAEIEKEPVRLAENCSVINTQLALKEQLRVAQDMPKIRQVCDVEAKAQILSCGFDDSGVRISGKAAVQLWYLTEDEARPICCLRTEVPFETTVAVSDMGADMEADLDAWVTGVSYTLSDSSGVEVRCNVSVCGVVYAMMMEEPLTEIAAAESLDAPKRPSVTVYFVQDGDTLWDIAKRCAADPAKIASQNDVDETTDLSGKKLIIPKSR